MYKDPDKQREANRQAQAKRRARGMTNEGMTVIDERSNEPSDIIPKQGVTTKSNTQEITPLQSFEKFSSKLECLDRPGGLHLKPKRGKDIKTFEDLPPDVQQTIDLMSRRDDKIDPIVKANRTAIAIHYQHLFPDRYYSTSIAI